ncbi:tyrosine protein kinase [Pelomyxa schiedti]|nr:tyrosine protein kinase [Pelomyxa schiedti]
MSFAYLLLLLNLLEMCSLDVLAPVSCKLTDFGTTRDIVATSNQNFTAGIGTPVYMSPELLTCGKYGTASDVFSFAVLTYFVFTEQEPYSGLDFDTLWKISEFVVSGKRLPLPETIPEELRFLIAQCWLQDANQRPRFPDISLILEKILEKLRTKEDRNYRPDPTMTLSLSCALPRNFHHHQNIHPPIPIPIESATSGSDSTPRADSTPRTVTTTTTSTRATLTSNYTTLNSSSSASTSDDNTNNNSTNNGHHRRASDNV